MKQTRPNNEAVNIQLARSQLLENMQPDPRAARLPPKMCAEIRRRQLEDIEARQQGFIDAGATLRRAELHKVAESLREQLAPYAAAAALERKIQLDAIEEGE